MKRILIIVNMLICALILGAQNISVSSFRLLETDLTANTAGTMEHDQNGEVAALIKVVTTQTGFTFDGGSLGIVKAVQKPGEIWVYVPRGLKKITISHPQLGILRDYYFPMAVVSARTYEIVLVTGTLETTIRQAKTSQFVVFQLTPPNAVVELDGELLQTDGGTATKMMKFGTYNYRVQAPNYLPEAGNVTVNDPKNKHVVNVALKPNFSSVTLKVDGDAEIWVNGERKGTGTWTGNLGAGTYELETRKPNHRSISITRDLETSSESQTITLQAPTPIFGEAEINSSPAMADIFIDGKKIGQTPQMVSDLLVGQHSVRISKQGYSDYNSTMTVREGETFMLSAKLEKIVTGQEVVERTVNDKSTTDPPNSTASSNTNQVFTIDNVSFNMIYVEGGKFRMGATSEQILDADKREKPVHFVTLSSYYIGETEVTQALWYAVMGYNYSWFKGNKRPIENISWDDCQEFVSRLNQKTGRHFRLPTEAEWEFAARGGNKSRGYYKYSGSNNLEEVAWYWENSGNSRLSGDWNYNRIKDNWCETHDVKTKQANELGLYDMSGNVWEWCQDWYGSYGDVSQTNPLGALSGSVRVRRGGAFQSDSKFCRVSDRQYDVPDHQTEVCGLRLVLQP